MVRTVEKNLAGQEDILIGEGTVSQTRNGQTVTVTKNRVLIPVNSTGERDALDTTLFPKCVHFDDAAQTITYYAWSGSAWAVQGVINSTTNDWFGAYIGAKSANPTVRNDGLPLLAGDVYFNSTTNDLRVYTGSIWSGDLATVAGIAANVTTVAGIAANVTTVAGIAANVTTVAGIAANITSVAGIAADVTTAATNIADIIAASTEASNAAGSATAAATSASEASTSADEAAASAAGVGTAGGITVDATSLVTVSETNLQTFLEGVDHALLKARGTGVSSSYVSTVAAGGTTFAQPTVHGEINSDQGYFHVSYAGATGITVADLTANSTYVYIDNTGALQQQTTVPTRQDWSRKMFTMRISVDTATNLIIAFEYLNNPNGNYANSMRDIYSFLLEQGVPFKKDQTITGRADLGFDVAAGTLLEFGGTGDIDNANILSFDAVSNVSYVLLSRTAIVSTETDLVKFWDNAETITALGSTTWVGHRLYRFSSGYFAMQYGQGNYANKTLAKAGVLTENYEKNPRLENATFFGWWFISSTATVTNGTTLTDFVPYTLGIQGGSSSAISSAVLKGNNGSDFTDTEAVLVNIGAEAAGTAVAMAIALGG
jgi:hypothetical protein